MNAVSLFSGIGGIELGLKKSGIETTFFCEVDPLAQAILRKNFSGSTVTSDILELDTLPESDIVTAGFPCQDLSQAGGKKGISGDRSGLVMRLFELLEKKKDKKRPKWLLIENVPYMLRLGRGQAMAYIVSELERLGYKWAYRIIDARCFGLPQRRPRVVLLASRIEEPWHYLFSDNFQVPNLDGKPSDLGGADAFGFYWTEGKRGVGWVREGVPPIKCGSTVGIASPPAVWRPSEDFAGMIDLRDAERLQGFTVDWTDFSAEHPDAKQSYRWRLVGNAVSTKLSEWVGSKLVAPGIPVDFDYFPIDHRKAWPDAAFGDGFGIYEAKVGRWASDQASIPLSSFLQFDLKPLSVRATKGFLSRTKECTNVVYSPDFISSLWRHVDAIA